MTRAVFFDVDFTLSYPGPTLQGQGYEFFCARRGVTVDPARFREAHQLEIRFTEPAAARLVTLALELLVTECPSPKSQIQLVMLPVEASVKFTVSG